MASYSTEPKGSPDRSGATSPTHRLQYEGVPTTEAGATGAPRQQSRKRRNWIIIALVALVALALILGLAIGLTRNKSSSSSSSSSSTSPSTTNSSTSAGQQAWVAKNYTAVSRAQLWNATQFTGLASAGFAVSNITQTRTFNWNISQINAAPGAINKNMIAVNGQSPGPIIHANLGDRLIINVHNSMDNETAVHWHGQIQNGTSFMDGTYSITQCGIPPGGSFTYNWTVQTVGTFWWHAHRSEQYTDGLYGALITHSPSESALNTVPYPIDQETTFLLSDLYNTEAMALQWRYTALGVGLDGQPGDEPVPDGGAINGVSQATCAYIPATDSTQAERKRKRNLPRSITEGNYFPETNYCSDAEMDYYNLTLPTNSTYRIRLVNSGTFLGQRFSIDNHALTLIEMDGVSIEPRVVTAVNLGVAQRASVIVNLNQTAGAYWIRAQLDNSQSTYAPPNQNDTTFGVLRYSGVSSTLLPADLPAPDLGLPEAGTGDTYVPIDKQDAPQVTKKAMINFNMQYSGDNQHYMYVNSSSWEPLSPGQNAYTLASNLATSSTNETALVKSLQGGGIGSQLNIANDGIEVFDLIVNSLDDGSHPFHLHGHQFYVMHQGDVGYYGDTSTLNVTNPMRRDTMVINSYGSLVLRFVTDNPGVWAFHCHIGWHMSIGLLMTFTDRASVMAGQLPPADWTQNCAADLALGY